MNALALTRFCTLVSISSTDGSDQAFAWPANTLLNTSGPAWRSSRNSSHIMFVHRDWPASENGAIPLALNFGIRSRMSPYDDGRSFCLTAAFWPNQSVRSTTWLASTYALRPPPPQPQIIVGDWPAPI